MGDPRGDLSCVTQVVWNTTWVTRGVTCGAVVNPCSGGDHITQQDAQTCNLWWCKMLATSCVLPSCCLWCPPSNLFASNKVSSSTRCARYVRHSQDFPPRAQYMYEKHFHNAKSWPLCCISPAPAPSALVAVIWSHLFCLLHLKDASAHRHEVTFYPFSSFILLSAQIFNVAAFNSLYL